MYYYAISPYTIHTLNSIQKDSHTLLPLSSHSIIWYWLRGKHTHHASTCPVFKVLKPWLASEVRKIGDRKPADGPFAFQCLVFSSTLLRDDWKCYFVQHWQLTVRRLLEVDICIAKTASRDHIPTDSNAKYWTCRRELLEEHRLGDIRMKVTDV